MGMALDPEGVTSVAEGVFRLHRAGVNCYLIRDAGGLTLVDAGLPGMWPLLERALHTVGARPSDIDALLLTHGHFDHVGFAEKLRDDHGVASHIHPVDGPLARHPYRYRSQSSRVLAPLRHPGGLPILARMMAAGALRVKGTPARTDVTPGQPVDAPGGLVPIFSPGHTYGHCGFHLASRGILFSGDALVTLDPYTSLTGPRVVAKAATADAGAALASLDALAATGATTILPGHGSPFEGNVADAVQSARRAGVA